MTANGRGRRAAIIGLATLWGVGATACDLPNPGVAPTAETLNFPIAVGLTSAGDPAGPQYLLVASSDFDLRFNAGALHSIDLDAVDAFLASCRSATPDPSDPDAPLPTCDADDATLRDMMVSEVLIGGQASSIAISGDQRRAYVAVRSDRDVTWVDVAPDGRLACGNNGDGTACSSERRHLAVAEGCGRAPFAPGDPVAVVAGRVADLSGDPADESDFLVVVHRNGRAGLALETATAGGTTPTLVHMLDSLPLDVVNAGLEPGAGVVWLNQSAANLQRASRDVALVGVALDARRECSLLFGAGRVSLEGVDDGRDTRDVAFDPSGQSAYLLSRRPEAVLEVRLGGTPLTATGSALGDLTPLARGPARMDIGEIGGRTFLFVTAFDAQSVVVVDVALGRSVVVVTGMTGPQDIAFDPLRQLLYVADFRDSVVRVIDVRPLETSSLPHLISTLGTARPIEVLR